MLDGATTQDAFDDCISQCNLISHSHSYAFKNKPKYKGTFSIVAENASGKPDGI